MHKMSLTYQQHTHIFGGCRSTTKLRVKRHNNTFLLLRKLLQTSNGGRWPIVGVDLGDTPIKDFTHLKPDIEEATALQLPRILHPKEEGLQTDKPNTPNHSQTIPEYILPTQHRPTHHKPDYTRAIGYTTNPSGQLIPDPTYRGRRQLQLIECKCSTDGNTQAVIDYIYNINEPLKQALQMRGTLKAEIKIIDPNSHKQNRHLQRQNTRRNRSINLIHRGASRHPHVQTTVKTGTENCYGTTQSRTGMALVHL